MATPSSGTICWSQIQAVTGGSYCMSNFNSVSGRGNCASNYYSYGATASLQVNAKKSTTAGTYYMWWSVDNSTWTRFTTALNTFCSNVGTTPAYPVGTTFYIMMSNASGPTVQGWSTLYSAGGTCPGTTTSCTSNRVTTVTSGLLTGWFTGNTASGTC